MLIKISKIHQRLSKHFITFLECAVANLHNLYKCMGICQRTQPQSAVQILSKPKQRRVILRACGLKPYGTPTVLIQGLPHCVLEPCCWVSRTREAKLAGLGAHVSHLNQETVFVLGFCHRFHLKGRDILTLKKKSTKISTVIMLDFLLK